MLNTDIYCSDQILNPTAWIQPATWIPNSKRPDICPLKYSGASDSRTYLSKYVLAHQDRGYTLFPDDKSSCFEFEVRNPAKGKDLYLVIGTALRADSGIINKDGVFQTCARVEFHYRNKQGDAEPLPALWKLGHQDYYYLHDSWMLHYNIMRVPGPRPQKSAEFQYDTVYQFMITRHPSDLKDNLEGDMMLGMVTAGWYFSCGCETNQLITAGCNCGGV